MLYPTYIVDNFFSNSQEVINLSNKFNFEKDPNGDWPGERTNGLHEIDPDFFSYTTYKILSVIFPNEIENLSWTAKQSFQKVSSDQAAGEGWVHSDDRNELTAIVYLSNHKKCGTSLYNKNGFFNATLNNDIKKEYYSNNKIFDKKYYDALKENNSRFTKTVDIDSVFNRLLIFDAHQYHAANGFYDENNLDDRLTLITFFQNIKGNDLKFPVSQMNRVL